MSFIITPEQTDFSNNLIGISNQMVLIKNGRSIVRIDGSSKYRSSENPHEGYQRS